ncbi:hypothetical protein NO2_0851 [Candidatus Termititenax persephonae]|uniref:Uncharacterized protein n=1 Tax=Candidatus Termititenax persephonae TaxID=2218525 RepID=A0A388THS9_9BACT|nr:hypothetical protein NO2_0851 [Candidatus Termititenax persephonae]
MTHVSPALANRYSTSTLINLNGKNAHDTELERKLDELGIHDRGKTKTIRLEILHAAKNETLKEYLSNPANIDKIKKTVTENNKETATNAILASYTEDTEATAKTEGGAGGSGTPQTRADYERSQDVWENGVKRQDGATVVKNQEELYRILFGKNNPSVADLEGMDAKILAAVKATPPRLTHGQLAEALAFVGRNIADDINNVLAEDMVAIIEAYAKTRTPPITEINDITNIKSNLATATESARNNPKEREVLSELLTKGSGILDKMIDVLDNPPDTTDKKNLTANLIEQSIIQMLDDGQNLSDSLCNYNQTFLSPEMYSTFLEFLKNNPDSPEAKTLALHILFPSKFGLSANDVSKEIESFIKENPEANKSVTKVVDIVGKEHERIKEGVDSGKIPATEHDRERLAQDSQIYQGVADNLRGKPGFESLVSAFDRAANAAKGLADAIRQQIENRAANNSNPLANPNTEHAASDASSARAAAGTGHQSTLTATNAAQATARAREAITTLLRDGQAERDALDEKIMENHAKAKEELKDLETQLKEAQAAGNKELEESIQAKIAVRKSTIQSWETFLAANQLHRIIETANLPERDAAYTRLAQASEILVENVLPTGDNDTARETVAQIILQEIAPDIEATPAPAEPAARTDQPVETAAAEPAAQTDQPAPTTAAEPAAQTNQPVPTATTASRIVEQTVQTATTASRVAVQTAAVQTAAVQAEEERVQTITKAMGILSNVLQGGLGNKLEAMVLLAVKEDLRYVVELAQDLYRINKTIDANNRESLQAATKALDEVLESVAFRLLKGDISTEVLQEISRLKNQGNASTPTEIKYLYDKEAELLKEIFRLRTDILDFAREQLPAEAKDYFDKIYEELDNFYSSMVAKTPEEILERLTASNTADSRERLTAQEILTEFESGRLPLDKLTAAQREVLKFALEHKLDSMSIEQLEKLRDIFAAACDSSFAGLIQEKIDARQQKEQERRAVATPRPLKIPVS